MEKNHYDNTPENYAKIDNNLAAAQLAIGQSSNLAQLCLTYTYNFEDQKYKDYVCILSVLAQVAIDNAKRSFDISLNEEIEMIKNDMDIKKNKYPKFWEAIRKDFNKVANDIQKDIGKIESGKLITERMKNGDIDKEEEIVNYKALYKKKNKINKQLVCPMNNIFDLKVNEFKPDTSTLPISEFYVKYELDEHRRKSMKVEELIQKYSFKLFQTNTNQDNDMDDDYEDYLLLRNDFEELLSDIKSVYISKNYLGLMSWLINRAFCVGAGIKSKKNISKSTIDTNKSLLLKVLYDINSDALLKCFSKNIDKNVDND